eukprot:6188407-Prymnesium_polylepis.1
MKTRANCTAFGSTPMLSEVVDGMQPNSIHASSGSCKSINLLSCRVSPEYGLYGTFSCFRNKQTLWSCFFEPQQIAKRCGAADSLVACHAAAAFSISANHSSWPTAAEFVL